MNKRKLPRHVDGRIKIGILPIKSFLKILPFCIGIVFAIITYLNPITLFIGVIALGLLVGLNCEIQPGETGTSILRDIIRYSLEGDIYYERSIRNIDENKKFIENEL
ncbi:hypothetical protein FDC64_11285 [Clostridium botulinum]|uniref:hypothetical protein n=1 Tax=Clostridium botulinum TaxID=1491 RepID=UPI0004D03B94|nr:hypothetical protein [Clostridium botulinum]MBY6773663.1 hypothetical protein [Clostridium botulinum]MBY6864295.1 hypothetical protein [Clostridium botulinum]MBY6984827.1 hypothetical protein [Clostridium botulinum]NFP26140.1 hypothetical protein [Clostridium botulinum]